MSRPRTSWSESLRALTSVAAEVLRAELTLLAVDYQHWGKRLAIIASLVLVAGWIVLWCLVFLLYAAVRALETMFGFGVWQAPLVATGGALTLAIVMIAVAFLLLKRLGPPAVAIRARYRDHRRWWVEQIWGEPIESMGDLEP